MCVLPVLVDYLSLVVFTTQVKMLLHCGFQSNKLLRNLFTFFPFKNYKILTCQLCQHQYEDGKTCKAGFVVRHTVTHPHSFCRGQASLCACWFPPTPHLFQCTAFGTGSAFGPRWSILKTPKNNRKNSVAVQWLGLSAFSAMPRFSPWSGNLRSQALWCSQKKKGWTFQLVLY